MTGLISAKSGSTLRVISPFVVVIEGLAGWRWTKFLMALVKVSPESKSGRFGKISMSVSEHHIDLCRFQAAVIHQQSVRYHGQSCVAQATLR